MDFTLTGTTPGRKAQGADRQAGTGSARDFHQWALRRISGCHVQVSFIQLWKCPAHPHAEPGRNPCGRVSGMEEDFERTVKAGEHGLKILAPCPYRRFIEQDRLDTNGKPLLDANGKPLRERTLVQLMRFLHRHRL